MAKGLGQKSPGRRGGGDMRQSEREKRVSRAQEEWKPLSPQGPSSTSG